MRTKWRGSLCKAPHCAATIRQLVGQESGRVAGARANLPRVCGPCVLCPCRRASRCPPAHLAPAPCSIRWRSRSRSRSRRRRRAGVPRCPAAPRAARPCHPLSLFLARLPAVWVWCARARPDGGRAVGVLHMHCICNICAVLRHPPSGCAQHICCICNACVCVWYTGRHPPRLGHFGSAHDVAVRRHHDMDICMCVNIES